jgi:hypothetical protein
MSEMAIFRQLSGWQPFRKVPCFNEERDESEPDGHGKRDDQTEPHGAVGKKHPVSLPPLKPA